MLELKDKLIKFDKMKTLKLNYINGYFENRIKYFLLFENLVYLTLKNININSI